MAARGLRWEEVAGAGAVFHIARHGSSQVLSRFHSHDFAELFWVESGTAIHSAPTGTSLLVSGDVVLVAPADIHGFETPSSDFWITNVAFARGELDRLRRTYFETSAFPWDRDPPRQYRLGTGIARHLIPRSDPDAASSPGARLALDRLLVEVLAAISGSRTAILSGWLAETVERWRRDPATMMRGVTGLAEVACRSRGHVSRVVREATGDTAIALVNSLRLEEAAARLRLTDSPIAAIAADVGFNSLGHFYHLFRIRYGTSPGRYRRP